MTNKELIRILEEYPATAAARVSIRSKGTGIEICATGFVHGVSYDPTSSSNRLTVSFTPGSLDFGSQPVVTPEPAAWIELLLGLTLLGGCRLTAHNTALRAHRIGASSCPY